MVMDPEATGPVQLAREAWSTLAAAVLAQRARWISASKTEGLTPPQAFSLMRLRPDAPPNLGEFARQMHCDASYATALADRLEERGLAERRVSATDRRVKELVPTAAGVEARERLRAAYVEPPEAMAELSPEELALLHRIAARLARDVDPDLLEMLAPPARRG